VRIDEPAAEPATVVRIGKPQADPWLVVQIDRRHLTARLAGGPAQRIGTIRPGQAAHVTIQWTGEALLSMTDGRGRIRHTKLDTPTAPPPDAAARFGQGFGGALWSIALHAEAIELPAIQAHRKACAQTLPDRPEAISFTGKLIAASSVPDASTIGTYSRVLAVNEYEVIDKPRQAKLADRVLVAEWVILDRQPLADRPEPGEQRELTVEPFADHEQLDAELRVHDIDTLDLPLYYNPAR
jgi:hypothetical protein